VLNPREREIVAFHEMGHALVALSLPGSDPVHKVSIIPRGIGALGYTIQRPTEDRFLMTREELEHKIAWCCWAGARPRSWCSAHLSTGAADDLAKVTDIARDMVTRHEDLSHRHHPRRRHRQGSRARRPAGAGGAGHGRAAASRFEFENFDWGGDWYRAHGLMMPADGLDALRHKDAILFGSAGDPHIPDHVTLWGLRLKICQGFDQYANVRPTRILPGIDAPLKRCAGRSDWVIVRENSEGEYAGVGGRVHQGHPIEAATDVSMMTRAGVERIMRFAFELARSRPRKLLTVVTKSNAQRHAMVMWDEIALQVSREFPDVTWDKDAGRRDDRAHGQPPGRWTPSSPPTCTPTS
jgi:hypothetical protein